MSLAICELLGFDHLTDINTIDDDEDEHEGIDIRMSRDGNYVVFVNTNPVIEETRNVKFSRYFDINKFRIKKHLFFKLETQRQYHSH